MKTIDGHFLNKTQKSQKIYCTARGPSAPIVKVTKNCEEPVIIKGHKLDKNCKSNEGDTCFFVCDDGYQFYHQRKDSFNCYKNDLKVIECERKKDETDSNEYADERYEKQGGISLSRNSTVGLSITAVILVGIIGCWGLQYLREKKKCCWKELNQGTHFPMTVQNRE